MSIIFSHGLESDPHGSKYQAMVAAGFEVYAPDCRQQHLPKRVEVFRAAIVERRPRLVVGSSFGGAAGLYAALQARAEGVTIEGLVLCAPALMLPPPPGFEPDVECPAPTTILHGIHDDIIEIGVSRRFARDHGAELIELDDGHRLQGSLDHLVAIVKQHLESRDND